MTMDPIDYLSAEMFARAKESRQAAENAQRAIVLAQDALTHYPAGAWSLAETAILQTAQNIVVAEKKNAELYDSAGFSIQGLRNAEGYKRTGA